MRMVWFEKQYDTINKSSPRDCKVSQPACPTYISCTLGPRAILETRSQTKMSNTKVVYILTPVPTLYDYSSPRYDQKHVFDLSITYDLDLWPKIILHNEDSTSNMYVQFQSNRIKTVVCRAISGLRAEPQTDTYSEREHYSLSARIITASHYTLINVSIKN